MRTNGGHVGAYASIVPAGTVRIADALTVI